MMAAGAVGVAHQFGVSEAVGEEILEELTMDASKVQVAVPGQIFRPPADLWQTTANVREVYTHYVGEQLAKQVDEDIFKKLQPKIKPTVTKLVKSIDQDLSVANLEHSKVLLGMPKVETRHTGGFSAKTPLLVLKAGAEHKKGFLGVEEVKVGYIQESIVDRFGQKLGLGA
jgi:hypothetical protein